ncbi:hypothetical protein [Phenylobacterium sp.]|jgi:hypothetical protein|uniref:hypothetical protein n=1 Tax=Phenylobacterium sp. TaxID=1871053 RepID=UPI002F947C61
MAIFRAMLTPEFCLGRAEECELRAEEFADPALRREWLRMAAEWRVGPSTTTAEPGPGTKPGSRNC